MGIIISQNKNKNEALYSIQENNKEAYYFTIIKDLYAHQNVVTFTNVPWLSQIVSFISLNAKSFSYG